MTGSVSGSREIDRLAADGILDRSRAIQGLRPAAGVTRGMIVRMRGHVALSG
ncbi:hypothetical protein BBAL3_669 [Brevundimonas sp. BAL3]|nr:hypothetical protein BBAL3_669 [Brevundimonas sp. BAL3]